MYLYDFPRCCCRIVFNTSSQLLHTESTSTVLSMLYGALIRILYALDARRYSGLSSTSMLHLIKSLREVRIMFFFGNPGKSLLKQCSYFEVQCSGSVAVTIMTLINGNSNLRTSTNSFAPESLYPTFSQKSSLCRGRLIPSCDSLGKFSDML